MHILFNLQYEPTIAYNMNILKSDLPKINMKINIKKTKTMILFNVNGVLNIQLDVQEIEWVKSFAYLEKVIQDNGMIETEIDERLGKVGSLFSALKNNFFRIK